MCKLRTIAHDIYIYIYKYIQNSTKCVRVRVLIGMIGVAS